MRRETAKQTQDGYHPLSRMGEAQKYRKRKQVMFFAFCLQNAAMKMKVALF
jgi:hypothetical protein